MFALHELGTKHGTHAEYCMTWAYTTAHLPHGTKMEGKAPQACIIPLTSSVNYVNADSKSVPKEAATIPYSS